MKKFCLAILVVMIGAGLVQPADKRPPFDAFEVATIKPTAPDFKGSFMKMQSAHRFIVMNYTLKAMIGAAYNLTPRTISGGAPWVASDSFDILAGTPGAIQPNPDEQMAMLRKLLSDRFKLTFHREPKEFPVYALTAAKEGSKLKESAAPADKLPELISTVYPNRVLLPARNTTMQQFVFMLQRSVVDRPVLDKTGLTGRYDFDLEWAPDESQFGGRVPVQPNPDEPPKPDLFAAMQRQLGLRLEATRGPVQTLVIDQATRPSDN